MSASAPIASSMLWAVRSCSRVAGAVLAAQPFAVQQVRAGQFWPQPGAAQPVGRFPAQALGGLTVARQRASTPRPKSVPRPG